MDLTALPGDDLVKRGLEDLRASRRTVEALLVEIGAPFLRACGLDVPDGPGSGAGAQRAGAAPGQLRAGSWRLFDVSRP